MSLTNAERAPNFELTIETLSDVAETARCRRPGTIHTGTVSGWIGVCSTLDGWFARIWFERHWVALGFWPTAAEAAREYDRVARESYGPFVRQNFPLAPGLAPSCDPEAQGRAFEEGARLRTIPERARA